MGTQPNEHLAALMSEAGYSNKAMARDVRAEGRARDSDVRCTHVDVGRWLGGTQPHAPKPAFIAAVLSRRLNRMVTPADVGMARPGDPAGLELILNDSRSGVLHLVRELAAQDLAGEVVQQTAVPIAALVAPMASWLVSPPVDSYAHVSASLRVGMRDVDAIRTALRMFESLDHLHGGGHARLPAVQYLKTTVSSMLEGSYPAKVGQDLFAVAAQFTYKTGAMAYDVGMHGLARRYFVRALNLANHSGDRALGGKALALMSHQANFLGEYREAVELARGAKVGAQGQATPAVHAMYSAMEARALASLGDKRACVQALNEAEQSYARAGTSSEPDWIAYFNQSEMYDEFAHCFAALRETATAARFGELALSHSQDPYRRSRTFRRLTLARTHLVDPRPRNRDVERACDVAASGLDDMTEVESARVRAYVRAFNRLLDPYEQVGTVVDLRERLAENQTA